MHESTCAPRARWRRAVAVLAASVVAGCAAPRHDVVKINSPTTARPQPETAADAKPTGSIFLSAGYHPLFEDPKPRARGDIMQITLNETLSASQSADNQTGRTGATSATVPKLSGVLGMALPGLSTSINSSNTFEGKGQTTSSNAFTGTIAVTVVEVLGNGNLVVAGEKQIGISQNSGVLKLTGVVDPGLIQPGNTISSTQVADVRLDYRGGGGIEEAQMQGWMSRFFNSWMPF
ncbi:MAG TPA: flagellar basal body L-ring protein FlgH [Burkholderiaceae bacterium]|nr:flagellar basal body L-ring protein FlgH [Burkholderiaceae bacterium]